jgi:solute carrier family 25 (mitochondrial phosphate transporter), member 23/24/25/41
VQCETTEGGPRGNQLLFDTAKKMWSHGGIRPYYRGLTLGLMGIIPYSAIDLGCFEGMKRAYKKAAMKNRNCSYEDAEPGDFDCYHFNFRESHGALYGSYKWECWGICRVSY